MSNLENNYKLWEQVQETVGYINKINNLILNKGDFRFRIGTEDINVEFILRIMTYLTPVSTVQGHKGALVFGTIVIKGGGHARPFSFLRRIP
jgi:purine-nucleoside phosphorylase